MQITKNNESGGEADLRTMTVTEHFGEQALIRDDVRSANAYAIGDVSCITLLRSSFVELLGNLETLREKVCPFYLWKSLLCLCINTMIQNFTEENGGFCK